MRFTRKHLLFSALIVFISFFLVVYQLPYYIYKPGGADELTSIVEVENGNKSKGDMHLVTVSSGQATPLQYLWAKVLPHHEIVPIKEVRPEGITEDEYLHAQLQLMESSQESSTVVAYEAANKDIKIEYNGVFVVSVRENMPADGQLEIGDQIIKVDQLEINESEDLIQYLNDKKVGDRVTFTFIREEEVMTRTLTLEKLDEVEDKVGIGIQLVTNREVEVNPEVHFSSGNIGGPSAGLMFSLEIYNQLVEDDITKGYSIIGTGAIDYEGNISRIGGIDKKVIAADKEACEIFFAPNENGASHSNYEEALETAKEIDTEMKIVPVDTFEDALEYLQNLEPKN